MPLIQTPSFQIACYIQGDQDAQKLAIVVPGKLDTKDYLHMRSHVDFLAQKGYLALSFDPPGTWESPGDITLYNMSNNLVAIEELIEYFGNKPTFVLGHSRGGSMAMLAGIRLPQVSHFGVIMSYPSFDPQIHGGYPDEEWRHKGYRVSQRDIPNTDPVEYREFKLPYSFLEDQIKYDMREGLSQCEKLKMFIYGDQDDKVKPELVKMAYDLSAEPKFLYGLHSGHDYRKYPQLITEVNNSIEDFLEKIEK